jgi:hypothetical protein
METALYLLTTVRSCSIEKVSFDDKIAYKNQELLKSKDIIKVLERNVQSFYTTTESTSCCPLACNPDTGEIYPYEEFKKMIKDQNMWFSIFRYSPADVPKYYIYCSNPSRKCIGNLIATERKLNIHRLDEWMRGLKNKIRVTKQKYGLMQALRWNADYQYLVDDLHLFTSKEIYWLT